MHLNNYQQIRSELDSNGVALVAVSKTKSPAEILKVYAHGHRIFGENRAQELAEKQPLLPDDVEWHMIGHLQTNKVKYIAPFVTMIQSVDSIKLLNRIEREAANNNRRIDVLLQCKIAIEPTKYGFEPGELLSNIRDISSGREHVRLRGLMGMASFVQNEEQVRREFKTLKTLFDRLKDSTFSQYPDFDTISMGMSGDYQVAVEEGSNMVRIGSLIFGARD